MDPKKSQNIKSIFEKAKVAFKQAENEKQLYEYKVQYMGKKGFLALAMKEIKNCPPAEKPAWGAFLNQMRKELDTLYEQTKAELSEKALEESLQATAIDLSLPGPYIPVGSKHPITKVVESITEIFKPLGYSIQTGPYVESDWYNFSALNFPPFHPSRGFAGHFLYWGPACFKGHIPALCKFGSYRVKNHLWRF